MDIWWNWAWMFCPLLTHYPSLFSRHCSDHLEVAPMTQKPPSSRTQLPPLFPPSKLEGEFCWSNSLRQNSTNSIRTLKPSSISQGVAGGRRKAFRQNGREHTNRNAKWITGAKWNNSETSPSLSVFQTYDSCRTLIAGFVPANPISMNFPNVLSEKSVIRTMGAVYTLCRVQTERCNDAKWGHQYVMIHRMWNAEFKCDMRYYK